MIAGDAHALRPQSTRVVYWVCAGKTEVKSRPFVRAPRHCGVLPATVLMRPRGSTRFKRITIHSKTTLELHVDFPDCWDGVHLDSPDHHSHMAYSTHFVCPRSHPVKVPLIRLAIRYPIRSGIGVELASGGQLTGHADFFNAWNQRALERLVDACFHVRPCNR